MDVVPETQEVQGQPSAQQPPVVQNRPAAVGGVAATARLSPATDAVVESFDFESVVEAPFPVWMHAGAPRWPVSELPVDPASANFDPTRAAVTVGSPCFVEQRVLANLGLQRMLQNRKGRYTGQARRSEHPLAAMIKGTSCRFASSPVGGGMQCCCQSDWNDDGVTVGGPNDLFCLPSLTVAGPRSNAMALVSELVGQHKYAIVTKESEPPILDTGAALRDLRDALPRAAARALPSLPADVAAAAPGQRTKMIAHTFVADTSADYFSLRNFAMVMRYMATRTKLAIVLQDPVQRAAEEIALLQLPESALVDAVHEAVQAIRRCSHAVLPGEDLPIPIDLMVDGAAANLEPLTIEYTGAAEALVLIDGHDGCWPDGIVGSQVVDAIARSLYLRPLQRALATFGDQAVILLDHDRLFADPKKEFGKVWSALSIYNPDSAVTTATPAASQLPPAAAALLNDFFVPYNRVLSCFMAAATTFEAPWLSAM